MINVGMHDLDYHLQEVTHDSVAYYMREGEAPGSGATAMGLAGEVTSGAIHDLFGGKHPNTGEYLIPSKGSNGRDRDAEASGWSTSRPRRPSRTSDQIEFGTFSAGASWPGPRPQLDIGRCPSRRSTRAAAAGQREVMAAEFGHAGVAYQVVVAVGASAPERLVELPVDAD